jgi:hypothetical protein
MLIWWYQALRQKDNSTVAISSVYLLHILSEWKNERMSTGFWQDFERISTVCFLNGISQVKLLITNNAFWVVQRATAQSKTGIIRGCGAAEALRFFNDSRRSRLVWLRVLISFFDRFISSSGISVLVIVLVRVQCRIGFQPWCPVVRRSVSLLLRS